MNIMSRTRNPRERAENPDTVVRRKGARAKVSPILFRHSCAKTLKAFAPLTSAEKVPLIVVANLPFELTHRSKRRDHTLPTLVPAYIEDPTSAVRNVDTRVTRWRN